MYGREVYARLAAPVAQNVRRARIIVTDQGAPARATRILFVTSNRLGDAVLSTGLLDHLLRTRPEARFTIVCGTVAAPLFAHMPRRERTIVRIPTSPSSPFRLLWLVQHLHEPRWAGSDRAQLGARGSEGWLLGEKVEQLAKRTRGGAI